MSKNGLAAQAARYAAARDFSIAKYTFMWDIAAA
jgi:hypothetical protein